MPRMIPRDVLHTLFGDHVGVVEQNRAVIAVIVVSVDGYYERLQRHSGDHIV